MSLLPYDRAAAFEAAFPARLSHGAGFARGLTAEGEQAIYATWMGGNDYRNKSPMYGAYPKGYLEAVLALFPDAKQVLHLFSGSLSVTDVADAWRAVHEDGQLPFQGRFDNALHPAARAAEPEYVGDAGQLVLALGPQHRDNYDLVLADPPYRLSDQRRYWREAMMALEGPCRHVACGAPARAHSVIYRASTREGALVAPESHSQRHEFAHGGYVRFTPLNKKTVIQQCAAVLRPGGWLVWLDEIRLPYDNRRWIWRGGAALLRSTGHRVRFAAFLERRA